MPTTLRTRTVATLVLGLMAIAYPAVVMAQSAELTLRVYRSTFLEAHHALSLALQVCGDDRDRCDLQDLGDREFTLRAPQSVHEEFTRLLAERDVPPPTQEFRVILLRARPTGSVPELPAGAREALADLASVMPYRGYELVDSGLLRTAQSASTRLGEMGSFEVEIYFVGDPRQTTGLNVSFALAYSPVVAVNERPGSEAGEGFPIAHLGDSQRLLESTFSMQVGETLVVGTSRLNGGDEALLVLLTAIDR